MLKLSNVYVFVDLDIIDLTRQRGKLSNIIIVESWVENIYEVNFKMVMFYGKLYNIYTHDIINYIYVGQTKQRAFM